MAPPTKFTPLVITRLLLAVQLGATYTLACSYAGITFETLNQWRKDEDKADFVEDLRRAEGLAVVGWLAKIEKAASNGNWQAAAWKLERRYPQQYGRTIQEQQGTGGGPVKLMIVTEEFKKPDSGADDLAE